MADLSGFLSGKRGGISPWISWVLLLVFVVLLASIVSYWMRPYVGEEMKNIKHRTLTKEYCDTVGIEIEDIVVRNAQTLNMKVINTYNLAINQIIFRLYDQDNNILINVTNVTIKPGQNKTIDVSKNATSYRLEAVPVILEDDEQFICDEKLVWKNITS